MTSINKRTPNKNPYLASLMFFLIILTVMFIFAVVASFIAEDGGSGTDQGGTAIFGAGIGDGIGGKSGNHGGEGTINQKGTSLQDSRNKTPGNGTNEKATRENGSSGTNAKMQSPESEESEKAAKKENENNSDSDTYASSSLKPANLPPNVPHAKLHWDGEQDQQTDSGQTADNNATGAPSFSSGGRSVFKVKENEDVVFIVDISPSMLYPTSEGLSRLEVLKIHLKTTLKAQYQKRSRGKYSIIAFSSHTDYFPPVDEGKKQCRFDFQTDYEESVKWIDRLTTGSGTFLAPPLGQIAQMIKNREIRVDTIFILTDGEPNDRTGACWFTATPWTSGDYINLLKGNIPPKIKVHTISIGRESQLLKDIAKAFNGKYEEYK